MPESTELTREIPLEEAFTAALRPEPPIAPPPPVALPVTRPATRGRRGLAIASVVGVVAVAAGAAFALSRGTSGADPVAASASAASGKSGSAIPTPASSSAKPSASTTARPSPTPAVPVKPVYAVSVNYADKSVPDGTFKNTLDWNVDLCLGDPQFAQPATQAKIALYRKVGGVWTKVPSTPKTTTGGRCGAKSVNVLIDAVAPTPSDGAVDKGWSACSPYRVVVPETSKFRKTNVDMCVKTKAETPKSV